MFRIYNDFPILFKVSAFLFYLATFELRSRQPPLWLDVTSLRSFLIIICNTNTATFGRKLFSPHSLTNRR